MTRCFGWHLPSTMLAPYADFFNHGTDGVAINIINTKFEREEKPSKGTYYLKKRRTDLAIVGDPALELKPEEREKNLAPSNPRLEYIKRRLVCL